ncbi:MAG: hypothetical protein IKS85_05035, partial [Lachnospiraceae bacterium]|nr:hypothetical protein [Lachnospiraceae bacterium]
MKKRIRKQLLAIMICLVITVTGFAGCACAGREGLSATENITAAGTASDEEQSAEQTLSSESDEAESSEEVLEEAPKKKIENYRNNEEGHYEFKPHVFSKKYLEYHGEGIMKSFFNMVDALRAGEDTFECTDENAYGWCTGGRLINYFFPVATGCIEPMQGTGSGAYQNGVGKINYTIPKEEFLEREKAFEEMVVSILNTSISDDYDDFEKCLGLYEYVTMNYRYDYYVYEHLNELPFNYTSTYRCFEEKHGICCEIAGMYNYLLLQCGIDSEECGGDHRE